MEDNTLSSDSSCEDVAEYFAKNFGISSQSKSKLIKESISGDILADITNQDLQLFDIKGNPFIKISGYLKKNKDKFKGKEINLPISSIEGEEHIKNFLENFLNFKGKVLCKEELLDLDEEKMKNFGFNCGQRKRLLKYINHFKNLKDENPVEDNNIEISISRKSSKEEISSYLEKSLKISKNLIEEMDFDADGLFSLEEDTIEYLSENITEKEKESFKKFVRKKEKMNIPEITIESSKEDILLFLKDKGQDINNLLKIDLEKIPNLSNDEKNILKKFIEKESQHDIIKTKEISKKFEKIIHPIELNSQYNVFFVISIETYSLDHLEISVYEKIGKEKRYYEPYFISFNNYNFINHFGQPIEVINYIIQITSETKINQLFISVKDDNNFKYDCSFETGKNFDFFYIDNLKFDIDNNPFINSEDRKISEFLEFFFIRKIKGVEKFQKELIQDINDVFEITKDKIILSAMHMLNFLKCCKEVNIKPVMSKLMLRDVKLQKNVNWKNQIIYLSTDDINCLITEENSQKISDIITVIYAVFDVKYLIILIKNNENYCPFLLELLNRNELLNYDINSFLNDEEITFLQNKLIKFADDKNKINSIIQLSKSLTKSLDFIRENCERICEINKNYYLNFVLANQNSVEDSDLIFIENRSPG